MQNLFWARVLRQVVVVETVCFGRSSLAKSFFRTALSIDICNFKEPIVR